MNATDSSDSTILVVDDTPANVSLLLDTLGKEGYNVLVAEDGESAMILVFSR